MRITFNIGVLLLLLTVAIVSGRGSIKPRVAGLEENVEYMELLAREYELQNKEDSLSNKISEVRSSFRNDRENAAQYGTQILKLEGEIFDVRNRIGIAAGRINSIEQEHIISNFGSMPGGAKQDSTHMLTEVDSTKKTSPNLVYNSFFTDKLPSKDYAVLLEAQEKEQAVANYVDIYNSNYSSIKNLAAEYKVSDNPQKADSIFDMYARLDKINRIVADSIAKTWDYVFDNKQYAYNYLLDRLNKMELLYEYEKKGAKVRDQQAELKDNVISADISLYGLEKVLILDYEKTFAKLLGADSALDSLQGAEKGFDTIDYNLAKVDIKERFFITYEDFQVYNPSKYSAKNPIPKCIVYPRGVIYRILIGSYARLQPVSVFKGVYPLSYIEDDKGRYNYYAAGYELQINADDAQKRLIKMGFKDAKVAIWDYGSYSLQSDRSTAIGEEPTKLYRIEIAGAGDDLSQKVKVAIKDNAEKKEISRSGDIFIIGPFDSMAGAQRVSEAIKAVDSKLSIRTIIIESVN